jgi:hypothetical protein
MSHRVRPIAAGEDAAAVAEPLQSATRSINVGSSAGARELLTRLDTGHLCTRRAFRRRTRPARKSGSLRAQS